MQTLGTKTPLPHADLTFGTKVGALPGVDANVRQLTEKLGPIAYMRQVHGDTLQYASGPGAYEETDALFTDRPDLWLGVTTADCVPVLVSSTQAVAVVHAGWRGLKAQLLPKTLRILMDEFGLDGGQLFVHIGPCIRQQNYEVESSFRDTFDEKFFAPSKKPGHLMLDLSGVARAQARDEGVPPENIFDDGHCTYAESKTFFSYRRSKQKDEPFNVQLSLIKRKK
jgi:YfiH family protein